MSAGWGAGAVYFPPDGPTFRTLFNPPSQGSVKNIAYVKQFALVIDRLRTKLNPTIMKAMSKALTTMEDGTPCPAPHVSVGALSVAGLAVTMTVHSLQKDRITPAP